MRRKIPEDTLSLAELKADPDKLIRQVTRTQQPLLLTSGGRGVAVMQSVTAYEADREERMFMRAVAQGLADVDAGRVLTLQEAKRRLGLASG